MPEATLVDIAGRLAGALAIGLLIGLERGWSTRGEADGTRVAGFRTFGLLGLLGGLAGVIGVEVDVTYAVVLLVGAVVMLGWGYAREAKLEGNVSVTSAVAALATLGLGLMATTGLLKIAAAVGAAMALLLSLRRELHGWLEGLSETEIKASVRFAVLAVAILPLLPDRAYGPYDAWNPRSIWLVVVLITGFSFAGYIAAKRVGPERGIIATAAVGSVVSSTAVTASLARSLRAGASPAAINAGVAIASVVMFGRVILLTALLAGFALPGLLLVIGPAAVVALLAGAATLVRAWHAGGASMKLGNPFELLPALGFALLVAVLALVTRWAEVRFGDIGIAGVLALTGAFDVDAAIVTLGGLGADALPIRTSGFVLAIPILINTAFKAAIVPGLGGRAGWLAAAPLAASVVAGLVALLVVW